MSTPSPVTVTDSLLARARALNTQARHVNPVLAEAYRRRAAELRLEAWLRVARRSPADIDDFTTLAA